ncbi:MAG TPA: hypothetical protein VMG12_34515 [Polyangiaceae bacterium]|nr:hypothetical protein [Polyangiaceae bacterium]
MNLSSSLRVGALLVLGAGCAHLEEAPPPAAPDNPSPAPAEAKPPATTLKVESAPIDALRSAYFSALAFTFENPSGDWHEVRKVSIQPERQMFGPAFESLVGDRLRAWQLATRDAQDGKDAAHHPALETLAPEAPPKGAAGSEAPAVAAGPPNYLLAGPFTIAPGLFTRKWIVMYSSAADALLGQDLVLSYELENGKTERVLVQYPKPEPKR